MVIEWTLLSELVGNEGALKPYFRKQMTHDMTNIALKLTQLARFRKKKHREKIGPQLKLSVL